MPHVNLQAAQSHDITRLLQRDFPREFRRASRVAAIHSAIGQLGGIPLFWITTMLAAAATVGTSPFLPLAVSIGIGAGVFIGIHLSLLAITLLLFVARRRGLASLSALVEGRYHVRLCALSGSQAIVESGSQDLSDISTDMHETIRFLEQTSRA